jgi:membrane peptidoglycan carboxypeptidase
MAKRRVVRKTRSLAKPKNKLESVINSLKPANLKAYWLSREGAQMALKIVGGGFLALFLVFLFFAKDLPSPGKINSRVGAQTTRFYDRTGEKVLYEVHGDKNRSVIEFGQMPDTIKKATIAVEDKNFYKHGAFSFVGIIRAAMVNVFCNSCSQQGGSTITQQYVKNALLTSERTFTRKIKELILSIEIEAFYSKDDILKLYLNEIPYGANAYGIQAAAKTYYNKDLTKGDSLTLDEAATLAAIPRAPTYYSPYGSHPDALVARRNLILDLMVEQKLATQEEAEAAKAIDPVAKIKEISPVPNYFSTITAPHFVLFVQEELEAKYGTKFVSEGGLKVITTLDLDKQKKAEDAISKNMRSIRAGGGSNASMVAGDPKTGQILAMVGSYNFSDPKFGELNVATADRQPGSSFKPFAYATAWAKNWGPGSTMYDVETDFGGGYRPRNYTLNQYGVISQRQAIGNSLNITSVKVLHLAGIVDTLKTAHSMGITTLNNNPDNYGLSLVLGSGEVKLNDMVNAYQSFANGGVHHERTPILKITDPKGKVVEEYKENKNPARVMDEQVAYLMNNVLSDNSARQLVFGTFAPFQFAGRPVAVKTGTTENFKDAWTMGYTPSLTSGVWVGNNDGTPMARSAGAIAAPVWHDFMSAALSGTPVEQFKRPSGLKEVTLDAETGRLPTEKTKTRRTDLFPSWYRPTAATETKSAEIDKLSGKLATSCTPPLARETVYSSEIHAEIPPSDPAYGRWEGPVQALAAKLGYKQGGSLPTESDDQHRCSDTKPSVNLSASVNGSTVTITASVSSGTFTANKLEISFDDQVISTQSPISVNPYTFTYEATSVGGHVIKAVVTDEGYYTGEDSQNITITSISSGSSFQGVSPSSGSVQHGVARSYSWTAYGGGGGGISYQLYVDGAPVGSQSGSTSRNNIPTTAGQHTWYVQAIQGGSVVATTSPITYTNAIP